MGNVGNEEREPLANVHQFRECNSMPSKLQGKGLVQRGRLIFPVFPILCPSLSSSPLSPPFLSSTPLAVFPANTRQKPERAQRLDIRGGTGCQVRRRQEINMIECHIPHTQMLRHRITKLPVSGDICCIYIASCLGKGCMGRFVLLLVNMPFFFSFFLEIIWCCHFCDAPAISLAFIHVCRSVLLNLGRGAALGIIPSAWGNWTCGTILTPHKGTSPTS